MSSCVSCGAMGGRWRLVSPSGSFVLACGRAGYPARPFSFPSLMRPQGVSVQGVVIGEQGACLPSSMRPQGVSVRGVVIWRARRLPPFRFLFYRKQKILLFPHCSKRPRITCRAFQFRAEGSRGGLLGTTELSSSLFNFALRAELNLGKCDSENAR